MANCFILVPFSFCIYSSYFLYCFRPSFVTFVFCRLSYSWVVTYITSYTGLLICGGKIDHIPLVLSLKWVRVWIVRDLPSPRLCFRAGYHVNDDVHYLTFPELCRAEGSWRFFRKLPLCCARCFLLASITKWRFRESWRSSRETSYQKECVYGSEERLYERWRIGRSWFSTRILHRAIITMYFAKWEFEPEVQRTNWPWRKRKVFASARGLVFVEVRASTCVSCSCIRDVKNYELQQV